MSIAEEKLKTVSSLITLSLEKIDEDIVQKQLHELLLCDTIDGKLYKYRSFDSNGFALKNLEEGTLHCSSASVFNDPFD